MSKKRKNSPHHQQHHTSDDKTPPSDGNLHAGAVQTVRIERDADYEEDKSQAKAFRKSQLTAAKLLNLITAIAAGGALIYAYISYIQWRDFRRNFRTDERAWVGIGKADARWPDLVPPGALLDIKNTGKTPAIGVVVDSDSGLRHNSRDKRQFLSTENHKRVDLGTLVGGGEVTEWVHPDYGEVGQPGSESLRESNFAEQYLPYIYGTITYRDIFTGSQVHTFDFCYDINIIPEDVRFTKPYPINWKYRAVAEPCGEHFQTNEHGP